MEDTVEKDIEGLAENIIAEDEQRRAQELVRRNSISALNYIYRNSKSGCIQHCTKTTELGSQTWNGEKISETGKEDPGIHSHTDSWVLWRSVAMFLTINSRPKTCCSERRVWWSSRCDESAGKAERCRGPFRWWRLMLKCNSTLSLSVYS